MNNSIGFFLPSLNSQIIFSLACGFIGLIVALGLIRMILAASAGSQALQKIAMAIQEGALAYLRRQIVTISCIAILIFCLFLWLRGLPTALGFLLGAVCSLIAGYVGMRIAVIANVRTAQAATNDAWKALRIAFNGGAVTGLLVVALALLAVGAYYLIARNFMDIREAINSLIGLALGASLISVFARLGGGIYTKAADVGADLVGKIEQRLDEDDPRNPATIADNVGDNVGDCAGMAADVFETYAVSLIGAVLVGFLLTSFGSGAMALPFLLGGISIIGSILGIAFVNIFRCAPGASLMTAVGINAAFSAIAFYPVITGIIPPSFEVGLGTYYSSFGIYVAALTGLLMTVAIVVITNYYTSTTYRPVQTIARASETGHATNVIAGIATGNHATALPVICIIAAILVSYSMGGLYGVAVAVMSMLSLAGIIISLDAFGPITDNAGGIAVMGGLSQGTREVTDTLDAVGNTMKAVTKGYAIASAGLAALVLFGSYVQELQLHVSRNGETAFLSFSLGDPRVLVGLLIGGLLPFSFSAFSLDAVGKAAGAVVREVRRQIELKPGILKGEDTPEYATCVDIVTRAALREMIVPALLPVLTVIVVAAIPFLGMIALGGVLVGTIVTGLFLAIAMTSAGGAWDNAKKFIESGNFGGKGSNAHAAAVTGDTVGDPYKDTAGPAINPMIKVVNIVAILIIPIVF